MRGAKFPGIRKDLFPGSSEKSRCVFRVISNTFKEPLTFQMINWIRYCGLQKSVDREARLSAAAAYFLYFRWAYKDHCYFVLPLLAHFSAMDLPYHFVTLDDAQNARRRQLLDRYGQLAQLSMLAPLVAFQLSFGIRYLFSKLRRDGETQSKTRNQRPGLLTIQWRRFQWSLDDQIVEGWGTKRVWLCATLWAVWLVVLVVKDTGDGMTSLHQA